MILLRDDTSFRARSGGEGFEAENRFDVGIRAES